MNLLPMPEWVRIELVMLCKIYKVAWVTFQFRSPDDARPSGDYPALILKPNRFRHMTHLTSSAICDFEEGDWLIVITPYYPDADMKTLDVYVMVKEAVPFGRRSTISVPVAFLQLS